MEDLSIKEIIITIIIAILTFLVCKFCYTKRIPTCSTCGTVIEVPRVTTLRSTDHHHYFYCTKCNKVVCGDSIKWIYLYN